MEDTLRLALLQTSLHWEAPEANRAHFSGMIEGLADPVDLVVLPEMFTTGFTMRPGALPREEGQATLDWMRETARSRNTALMGSVAFHEDGQYYNRLFFVPPNGETSHYDKRHAFTLAGEHQVYGTGSERLLIDYKGFRICPMICYDLRFPVWSRNTVGYDVLVYVANWPEKRITAWNALLKARAIENMAYCVGVNRLGQDGNGHAYSGHSAVYDALGETIALAQGEGPLLATLHKRPLLDLRRKLRFLEDRDTFSLTT